MDRREHQAIRCRQGLRSPAPPLGRRTNAGMAQSIPPSRQGLRANHRLGNRLDLHRICPALYVINDRPFGIGRIDEEVRLGDVESWKVSEWKMPHPLHTHEVHFDVLRRDGHDLDALDQWPRNTIVVQGRWRCRSDWASRRRKRRSCITAIY